MMIFISDYSESEENEESEDEETLQEEQAARELLASQMQTLHALRAQHQQLLHERDLLQQLEANPNDSVKAAKLAELREQQERLASLQVFSMALNLCEV